VGGLSRPPRDHDFLAIVAITAAIARSSPRPVEHFALIDAPSPKLGVSVRHTVQARDVAGGQRLAVSALIYRELLTRLEARRFPTSLSTSCR